MKTQCKIHETSVIGVILAQDRPEFCFYKILGRFWGVNLQAQKGFKINPKINLFPGIS